MSNESHADEAPVECTCRVCTAVRALMGLSTQEIVNVTARALRADRLVCVLTRPDPASPTGIVLGVLAAADAMDGDPLDGAEDVLDAALSAVRARLGAAKHREVLQ